MYPKLIVDKEALKNNIKIIKELVSKNNIDLCVVTKVFHSNKSIIYQ